MTEQVLRNFFDFQRFVRNPKLDEMIRETGAHIGTSLSESELEYVNAAGVPAMMNLRDSENDRPL